MTPDFLGIVVFLLLAAFFSWRYFGYPRRIREQEFRETGLTGMTFQVAGAGTMFVPRFNKLVEDGSVLHLPSGDGGYPGRNNTRGGQAYVTALTEWVRRGAKINVYVTEESPEAAARWKTVKGKFPDSVRVFLLDKDVTEGSEARSLAHAISALATYHPVVLEVPTGRHAPGAMWIEAHHPSGSRYAYNVRFVPPMEVTGADRELFNRFLKLYADLQNGPHSKELFTGPQAATSPASRSHLAVA